ncbi:single-stranded-DNA-specific exonuclease RecJ [Paenibacillus polymyxa]|uniref:single-stranded-DNA-specific exonuclease RecJ n=1 Tax=Paenibacillus polymyxa TaxID=1406 RepID=UPI0025B715F7|nr:single-stranded-DNA-specific exonuclease RecJ [Paenibacillus polymyxa]MDN4088808.1 single-stranded-DNA-specific exonuclease RecJ [Paenibacillus polymyxa]
MLHSQYRWKTPEVNLEAAQPLTEELGISPLLSRLLVNRGVTTAGEANRFLYGSVDDVHDPFLLLGMKEAVPRIRQALERGEHILIYGDYDADGVSSTSLMIQLMRFLKASYDIYIPHRSNEGYGLHNHALDWAHQQGVTLVITVDTGISAVEQIAYATSLGIDVIVTDHHEPPAVLPEAYTLINPKLPDCPYPFKGLAGVGVALKLAQALLSEVPEEWFEIAAIGTVADLMPLHGENRTIVRRGIQSMRNTAFPGIRALLHVAGVEISTVTSVNIAFALAPRINASGRLDHAGRAVSLLTTEKEEEADQLAHALDLLNRERQQVVEHIVEQAEQQLASKLNEGKLPSVIVLAGEGWNVGVVGIVASKLLDRYYRPTIILGIDAETGMCKGSARSIPALDIYSALTDCHELMEHFGGHPSAAGMTLSRDNLELFEERLNCYAGSILTPEDFIPIAEADMVCRLDEVSLQVVEELELLQPFGMGNPSPRFILQGLQLREARKMGREKNHVKLLLEQNGLSLDAIAFRRGDLADFLQQQTDIDLLGELSINEWNGKRSLQLMMQDIRVQAPQIFDYRGVSDPLAELERGLRIFHPSLEERKNDVAVLIHPSSQLRTSSSVGAESLWLYDKDGSVTPSDGRKDTQHSVKSLFVLEPPDTPEQFHALWSTFENVENVFLLHSISERGGRLVSPDRELFKRIYIVLSRMGTQLIDEKAMLPALSRQCSCSVRMLSKVLDIFEDLEFLTRTDGQFRFVSNPPKRDLTASPRYQELYNMAEMERYLLDADTTQMTSWIMSLMKGAS